MPLGHNGADLAASARGWCATSLIGVAAGVASRHYPPLRSNHAPLSRASAQRRPHQDFLALCPERWQ